MRVRGGSSLAGVMTGLTALVKQNVGAYVAIARAALVVALTRVRHHP